MGRVIVCWGEILWDLYPDTERLGGSPANVAFHLAAMGEPVVLLSRVGDDDLGGRAIDALAARGVDTSRVQVDPVRPTGRVEVAIHDGEARYRLTPGCAWERIAADRSARAILAQADAFCYGTLSQRVSSEQFERALAVLPERCIKVCDPNLRPKHVDTDAVRAALAAADVVKVNHVEAAIMADRFGVDDVVSWMLDELAVGVVALTRGPGGSVWIDRTGRWEHLGFPAGPGGDNVGAGDAFTAVLTAFLLRGAAPDEVNRAANRYGAFVASRRGATPDPPAELLAELDALA
ncbi:MAG: PfkB family carbohydrate kinase [Proteobacteria bacterium]|nr:PfkB family carbohydrate kinase [Pseudomonadota bacterium]